MRIVAPMTINAPMTIKLTSTATVTSQPQPEQLVMQVFFPYWAVFTTYLGDIFFIYLQLGGLCAVWLPNGIARGGAVTNGTTMFCY